MTEKGFEKMDMLQEVTAKPQQVIVGTDVEKLDAKNFVEIKDGEVVGFVENQLQQNRRTNGKSRDERPFRE